MTAPVRRKRGTPTVGVQVNIAPDVKELLDVYVRVSGAPQWAIIEAAIRAAKPGANGIPDDWELPASPQTPLEIPGEAAQKAA